MAEHDTIADGEAHKDLCKRWRDVELYKIPTMDELITIRDGTPDVQLAMLTCTLP